MAKKHRSRLAVSGLVLIAIIAILVGLFAAISRLMNRTPTVLPSDPQCAVEVDGHRSAVTLDQAGNLAIISAEAIGRGLVPRASTIGIVTAWQESGLRNLSYGDRDSLGLFQQRPSQGWGTPEQITDPWYASGRFYTALVKVPGWETGDINNVAQSVQRSGFPEAYRKHVENGRAWASALTGHSPRAVTCIVKGEAPANPGPIREIVRRSHGSTTTLTQDGSTLAIKTPNEVTAWSVAQLVLTVPGTGLVSINLNGWSWTNNPDKAAEWVQIAPGEPNVVRVTLRS